MKQAYANITLPGVLCGECIILTYLVEITNKMQLLVYIRMWWLRPVTTCVCKPESANTVRASDDERYAARNMLSLQW